MFHNPMMMIGGGATLLLDTYTGATSAYSVRKLKSSATLAIRVRRTSDNVQQDIGFVGENLDTSSLASFVGSSDFYVVTKYDQIGTNHLTSSNNLEQPKLGTSGSLITVNGIAAPFHEDIFRRLKSVSTLADNNAFSVFQVLSSNTYSSGNTGMSIGPNSTNFSQLFILYPFDTNAGNGYRTYLNGQTPFDENGATRTGVHAFAYNQDSLISRSGIIDGSTVIAGVASQPLPTNSFIYEGWATVGGHSFVGGNIMETIVFNGDGKLADRVAIQNNQKAYYGIT